VPESFPGPPAVRNSARERLERGELSLGFGVRTARSVEIAKAMKTAGFDWLFLDLEHSAMSIETASQIAIAALDAGIAPIVRVPKGEYSLATRLLDNGALGIVLPHVDTADEAREAAQRLRYPPQGHRGVFSSMPHYDYRAVKVDQMTADLNAANLIIVMLETPAAIDNADANRGCRRHRRAAHRHQRPVHRDGGPGRPGACENIGGLPPHGGGVPAPRQMGRHGRRL